MHTYITQHVPPVHGAPFGLTTVVSPHQLTDAEVAARAYAIDKQQINRIHHSDVSPQPPSNNNAACVSKYQNCYACHLSSRRVKVFFTVGAETSPVLFLGARPSRSDETSGTLLEDKYGRYLGLLLREYDLDIRNFTYTTALGCRSTARLYESSRDPSQVEFAACSGRLTEIFNHVKPYVVVCLGHNSWQLFWPDKPPTGAWTFLEVGGATVYVTYLQDLAKLAVIAVNPDIYVQYLTFLERLSDVAELYKQNLPRPSCWDYKFLPARLEEPIAGR